MIVCRSSIVLIFLYTFSTVCGLESCFEQTVFACASASSTALERKGSECDSRFGGLLFDDLLNEFKQYINLSFNQSFEYMVLANNFNMYQKNRPGLRKMFKKFSEEFFKDVVHMIKHIAHRGGMVSFEDMSFGLRRNLDLNEIQSLALALDNTKELVQKAMQLHMKSSQTRYHRRQADPEIAYYIEKQFLPTQAETIKILSGHVNDLAKMLSNSEQDDSLALHLFDEYLSKQY